MWAAQEPSGVSTGFSQRELRELEREFPELESPCLWLTRLICSYIHLQVQSPLALFGGAFINLG
jgi:hypothetical protein